MLVVPNDEQISHMYATTTLQFTTYSSAMKTFPIYKGQCDLLFTIFTAQLLDFLHKAQNAAKRLMYLKKQTVMKFEVVLVALYWCNNISMA